MHFSPGGQASQSTSVICIHHSLLELDRTADELDCTETDEEELCNTISELEDVGFGCSAEEFVEPKFDALTTSLSQATSADTASIIAATPHII